MVRALTGTGGEGGPPPIAVMLVLAWFVRCVWPVASGLTAAVTPTCSEALNAGALRPATPRAASRIFHDVLFTFARLARYSVSRVFRSGAASGLLRGLQPRVIPHFLGRLETAIDRFFRRAESPCRRIEAQKADGG